MILGGADARLKDAVGPQQNTKNAAARRRLRFHLAARVADKHDLALLLEQARDPLVIADTAVYEAHYIWVRIKVVKRYRLKNARNGRGRTDGLAEPDLFIFVGGV